jgi:hypothetical protein
MAIEAETPSAGLTGLEAARRRDTQSARTGWRWGPTYLHFLRANALGSLNLNLIVLGGLTVALDCSFATLARRKGP